MTNATAMTEILFTPQVCKDRAVIAVSGVAAAEFLQNLLTVDVLAFGEGVAGYGALLSPQGKILHDMFVVRDGETMLLDCDREQAPALLQKLTFYRLRAKLELKIREDLEVGVMPSGLNDPSSLAERAIAYGAKSPLPAVGHLLPLVRTNGRRPIISTPSPARLRVGEGGQRPEEGPSFAICHSPAHRAEGLMELVFADPRLDLLGWRSIAPVGTYQHGTGYIDFCRTLGIPSSTALVGQFAHEANLDQLNGLALAKGCYVGQEIVSRMEHRGTARSRILPFQGNAHAGAEIRSGDVLIGQVLEVGIGLFRIDRLVEISSPLLGDGAAIYVRKPDWLKIDFTIPEFAQ